MRTTPSPGPSFFWKMGGIIALTLLARLSLFLAGAPWDPVKAQQVYLKADPGGYHQLALNLIRTGQYIFRPDKTDPEQISKAQADPKLWRLPGEPEALWPPLYSLFIAGIYLVAGVQIAFVLLAQIILSSVVVWLLALLALRLFNSERIALFTAFLFAIEPTMILLPNIMYSDFIFILFLSIFYFAFVKQVLALLFHSDFQSLGWGFVGGLSLGLAAMTHARGTILLPVVLLVLLFICREIPWRRRLLAAALALVGYFAGTGYWYWRNYRVFGELAFSTAASYNLLIGTHMVAPVETREESIEWVFRQARLHMESKGDPLHMNPFERAHAWRETALRLIREHPFEYFRAHLKRVLTVAFIPGTSEYAAILGKESSAAQQYKLKEARLPQMNFLRWTIFLGTLLITLFVYGTGMIGLLKSNRSMPKSINWLVGIIFAIILLTSVSNTHPRMRAPALLLILPYSSAGYFVIKDRVSSLLHRRRE